MRRRILKVFLVEDSPLLRKRIFDSLDSLGGYDVIGYSESEGEAIQAIAAAHPDVVITDIRLKEGNGIEVVRQVRSALDGAQPRIFVLSNYAYPEYRQQCELAGADDFFDKSSEYDRFLQTLGQQVA
jgi:DNA-binding NarL/FixJ family response regulator